MINLNDILEKVYLYYPKNIAFDSFEYQNSKEYLNLLKKREDANCDKEHRKYLEDNLKNIFEGYEVADWTELEQYNAYEYRILTHKEQNILDDDVELMKALGYKRYDLFLFISVLERYYYINMNYVGLDLKSDEWTFEIYHKFPHNLKSEIENLRRFLATESYIEISEEIAKEKIFDIETELKSIGSANVFDCFFTDLITI